MAIHAVMLKDLKPSKKKKKKRKLKPYRRADYPGQKIQIDVKYVPSYCVADGRKYYQYTAVDECSRWTYREMYDEHSTYSSKDFLLKLMERAPFQSVKCRQTMDLSLRIGFFQIPCSYSYILLRHPAKNQPNIFHPTEKW